MLANREALPFAPEGLEEPRSALERVVGLDEGVVLLGLKGVAS